MNSVTIVGRAGRDAEIKYLESGNSVTTLSVAVDRWDAAKKERVADWYNVEIWGKQAENASEYIKKGRLVAIEGRLRFDKWTGPDGTPNSRPVINSYSFRLVGGRND